MRKQLSTDPDIDLHLERIEENPLDYLRALNELTMISLQYGSPDEFSNLDWDRIRDLQELVQQIAKKP